MCARIDDSSVTGGASARLCKFVEDAIETADLQSASSSALSIGKNNVSPPNTESVKRRKE
jgi:hypothetical protein